MKHAYLSWYVRALLCCAPGVNLGPSAVASFCFFADVLLLVVVVVDCVGRCWREQANIDLGTDRTAIEIAAGGNHTCARLDTNEIKVSA